MFLSSILFLSIFLSQILTCTQNIFSEERKAEQSGQDCECGSYSGEGFSECVAVSTETWESSHTHDTMGVATQNIVLTGTQLGSLHQLRGKERTGRKKSRCGMIQRVRIRMVTINVQGSKRSTLFNGSNGHVGYLHRKIVSEMSPYFPASHKLCSPATWWTQTNTV